MLALLGWDNSKSCVWVPYRTMAKIIPVNDCYVELFRRLVRLEVRMGNGEI
jgi:hypothetical protein